LENIVLDKIQGLDDIIVPGGVLKVQNEGQKPKQYFDPDNLGKYVSTAKSEETTMLTGIEMRSRIAMPAATAIAACL